MNYKYYTIVILGLLAFSACEKDDIDIPATDNEVINGSSKRCERIIFGIPSYRIKVPWTLVLIRRASSRACYPIKTGKSFLMAIITSPN